ncbi:MAG: alkaline phosphatase family protein [Thermoanaerobaculia bacterium]
MALPPEARPADLHRLRRGWLAVLGGGFAPGALAGVQLAGLIFFLNPRLPFAFAPVLRGCLIYGALVGAVGLALHLPLTWGRPGRARRVLPWSLTLALALSAVIDWTHASYFAYFLPPGINDRLIKTALWLTLGALIAFYTALLHSLSHRRYGPRSRWGLALMAALSVYAMVERREAFRPRPVPTPRPAVVESGQRPRLWVIGLDAATLDAILPLAGQGRLPFLATVLQNGAYGRLSSLSPTRRDALWTTLATGKYPFKHGITGRRAFPAPFLAPGARLDLLPSGISFTRWGTLGEKPLPPGVPRREALALWEILPRLGVPAGVVGWPAIQPEDGEAAFALTDGSLLPASPQAADPALLSRFGPRAPGPLLQALDADRRRQSAALALAGRSPRVEAVFLLLPGLREVSRRWFGGFSAVQLEGEPKEEISRAATERVVAYYEWLDDQLAAVWRRETGPRLLAVVSSHGVNPQGGWRRVWGQMSPGAALGGEFQGAPDGVLLLYGEGIRPNALLTGARLVDVAPTLLYGLGFPVSRELDGQVLTAAFDKRFLASNPVAFFPSYEGLARAR